MVSVELSDLALVQRHAVPEAEVGDGAIEILSRRTKQCVRLRPTNPVINARQICRFLSIRRHVGEHSILVELHGRALSRRHNVDPCVYFEER